MFRTKVLSKLLVNSVKAWSDINGEFEFSINQSLTSNRLFFLANIFLRNDSEESLRPNHTRN
jgi:hypothetical protein